MVALDNHLVLYCNFNLRRVRSVKRPESTGNYEAMWYVDVALAFATALIQPIREARVSPRVYGLNLPPATNDSARLRFEVGRVRQVGVESEPRNR